MGSRKTVFTTGDVAKLCNVAPRTVSKWFDAGHLRGYRIPGSKDRRIPLEHLLRFMRVHGIPLNGLETDAVRVLVYDSDPSLGKVVCDVLKAQTNCSVTGVDSALEAGVALGQHKPNVFIIDIHADDVSPTALVRFVRSSEMTEDLCLIATGPSIGSAEREAITQWGFDGYLSKPFDIRTLIELIQTKELAVNNSQVV